MQNPDEGRKLIEGEIWLARENALAVVKGYVLKLEYLNASGLDVEKARERFCTFVTVTPVFDWSHTLKFLKSKTYLRLFRFPIVAAASLAEAGEEFVIEHAVSPGLRL